MAVESGQDYNPESARDLRSHRFVFEAFGEAFIYTLEIPEYILTRLRGSETMNRLQDYMEGYCRTVITDAMKGGYYTSDAGRIAMRGDVGRHLKNYVWERFSISQEQAGQDCWQTAPTLQEVHTT